MGAQKLQSAGLHVKAKTLAPKNRLISKSSLKHNHSQRHPGKISRRSFVRGALGVVAAASPLSIWGCTKNNPIIYA